MTYELSTFTSDRSKGIWRVLGTFNASNCKEARGLAEKLAAWLKVPCGWREIKKGSI